MKLKISRYIHDVCNLQIIGASADTSQQYYLKSPVYRITDYKRMYNDHIKCFPIYKNTSIFFRKWLLINAI